ncbi:UNVERIFIED_CONTAM: Peptidyl-prolyl cis-trans isomerase FKBP43 [Sesamum radiatum]|uniref:peptidylprolyl isomerase n=1 Tax=Sesamum radiatum TaxID=300843 RepID=A0AAW2S280_SESRA
MAFWGVEVKPGKRVLSSTNGKRLRITQASLGIGIATKKTIVQCSVGRKKRPIILCALVPHIAESCRLELEFDEVHDLIFTVIGPQSIHLTGYFVQDNKPIFPDSDTEPYGFSIEDTEGDSYHSEDDQYEDSFIDDSELPILSPSRTSFHQGKKKTKELRSKRLKKKLVVDFNESDDLNESKDGDTGNQGCQPNDSKNVEDDLDHVPVVGSCENVLESKLNDIVTLMGSSVEDESANFKNAIEVVAIEQRLDISNEKDIPTHRDETMTDADANTIPDSLPMDTQSKKRTLEINNTTELKKSKFELEGSSGTNICNAIQNEEKVVMYEPNEEKTVEYKQDDVAEKQCEAHSLSNGLIIEELTKRDPNGKLALHGRKVKIHFTGMLKETGVVFDTSVGKKPCKFRLGDEEIIDGFNMGIDGMRLGDKRRLIIPPSLGFGEQGFCTSVPPNSWRYRSSYCELVGAATTISMKSASHLRAMQAALHFQILRSRDAVNSYSNESAASDCRLRGAAAREFALSFLHSFLCCCSAICVILGQQLRAVSLSLSPLFD